MYIIWSSLFVLQCSLVSRIWYVLLYYASRKWFYELQHTFTVYVIFYQYIDTNSIKTKGSWPIYNRMSVRGQRINLAFDSFKMTKARNEEPPAAT